MMMMIMAAMMINGDNGDDDDSTMKGISISPTPTTTNSDTIEY